MDDERYSTDSNSETDSETESSFEEHKIEASGALGSGEKNAEDIVKQGGDEREGKTHIKTG